MRKSFKSLLVLPVLATLPLAADEPTSFRAEVGVGAVLGTPAYKKALNNTHGTRATVGLLSHFQGPDLTLRFSLSAYNMPGKKWIQTTTDLKNTQLSMDAVMPTWLNPMTWSFGLSVNKWTATNEGTEIMGIGKTSQNARRVDCVDAYSVRAGIDDKGVKIGLRVGLNYAITRHWSIDAMFQQTELAGGYHVEPNIDPAYPAGYCNRGSINPSWVEIGVRYTF